MANDDCTAKNFTVKIKSDIPQKHTADDNDLYYLNRNKTTFSFR